MTNPVVQHLERILKIKDTDAKCRGVAILLSAYVDEQGHFQATPKNILLDMLVEPGRNQNSRLTSVVSVLTKNGWLENRLSHSGKAGDWYLSLERLGTVKDIALDLEVHVAVTELFEKYPPQICEAIADQIERRLRS